VGLARCGTVLPVFVVVVAAVPAAVCCWGLCPRYPDVGRCHSGVNISSSRCNPTCPLGNGRDALARKGTFRTDTETETNIRPRLARASPASFVTHHTQQISKTAVVNDSKAILKCIISRKQKACSCAPSTTGAAYAASGAWRA